MSERRTRRDFMGLTAGVVAGSLGRPWFTATVAAAAGAEAGNAEIVAPDEPVMPRQFLPRQPCLALPVDVLPFVLADRARRRRLRALQKLRATLFASP